MKETKQNDRVKFETKKQLGMQNDIEKGRGKGQSSRVTE